MAAVARVNACHAILAARPATSSSPANAFLTGASCSQPLRLTYLMVGRTPGGLILLDMHGAAAVGIFIAGKAFHEDAHELKSAVGGS